MKILKVIHHWFCNSRKIEVQKKMEIDVNIQSPNKDLNIAINPLITTKDVRDRLWSCRDFELSHLWQRSIFLTTLLVLCLTAYGIVVMNLVEKVSIPPNKISIYALNNIAMVICLIGFVFSCLWVMMGKGSKAWYEMYEKAIGAFEINSNYVAKDLLITGEKELTNDENKKAIGGFRFMNIKDFSKQGSGDIQNSLLNCKGGAYSPSKINIAIGQITLILWGIALITHFILSLFSFCISQMITQYLVPSLLVFIFFVFCFFLYSPPNNIWVSSSSLTEYKSSNDEKQSEKK